MDQTFHTWSDFYECTIVGHHNHFTLHAVANLEVWIESIPWMRHELLQAESDALLLFVEVENNHIELLVRLNDVVRIVNTAPREVGDVDKTIYATQVDEHTVRGDVLNSTFEYLTLFELSDDFLALLFS